MERAPNPHYGGGS